jgi:hypothetical protein
MMVDLPETRDLFYPCEPGRVECSGQAGLRVGRDLEASIVVLDSGPVIACRDDAWCQVNTSVEQYRRVLTNAGRGREQMALEPENDELVDELEACLREGDAAVLDDPGSYWSLILEQIRDWQF